MAGMQDRHLNEPTTTDMVWVPGGTFSMGSEDDYPEEAPVRRVEVDAFWIDRHPVTNADFRRFVTATDYVTTAERPPNPDDYPTVDPSLLVAGSLVFERPHGPVPLHDHLRWWRYVPDACWYRPEGRGSSIDDRLDHPVVHVAFEDALAYAAWAGKTLPSEAEWEFAARGGLDGARYVWGDGPGPECGDRANTWQGEFPWQNLATDGYEGTSPVGAYPPNGHGLHDMAGNVWEWTVEVFDANTSDEGVPSCCSSTGIRR